MRHRPSQFGAVETVSQRLQRLRLERGLSRAQLRVDACLRPGRVRELELEPDRCPALSFAEACRLSQALGCDLDYLAYGAYAGAITRR